MDKHYLYVMLVGIISGAIVFGGKVLSDMGLSLFEISLFPFAVALLSVAPFVLLIKKYNINLKRWKLWILYGFVAAAITLTQFAPVIMGVPVALAVLLLYTQPLWTFIFSKHILKEKLNKTHLFAGLVVIAGVIVLVNPFTIGKIGSLLGIIIALVGGICLSGWITVGSYASKTNNHPVAIKFGEVFFMLLFLGIFFPLITLFTKDVSITALSFNHPLIIWIAIILFGLITQTLGHILYFKGVQKVPTADAGIILLLEPVSAALLAAIFLKQVITINIIVGGLLILIANYLVIPRRKSKLTHLDV